MRDAWADSLHIHLDPVGGIAGDMFVGALLDSRPQRADGAIAAARLAGLEHAIKIEHSRWSDGILTGSRFDVTLPEASADHSHVHWSSLKQRLDECALPAAVRSRAISIFSHLAEAEAQVHGKPVSQVSFHEVGAWDSIADIVAAAYLIESLGECSWSIGAIPLGSGRVPSAHGLLPVPAPATVLLLAGFKCFDDGYPGERVTPTGAAIIKHLAPTFGLGSTPRRLERIGYGFGTRRFEGMSNVLRAIQFDTLLPERMNADEIAVLRFEIDDQTAEDLALGLDRLRALEGVVDVTQVTVTGKQGRLMSQIQILARPASIDWVTRACFHETTTLGIRVSRNDRVILPRDETLSAAGVRVKIAERDAGHSAKAALGDLATQDGHQNREALRRHAETQALAKDRDED